MRFGVNYIPSDKWLHSWIDFDKKTIYNDLVAIKSLGFDHIRAHLLWSYFQPNENRMSEHCMRNLKIFDRLCREVGIEYFLSLFTGFMSGFFFFPAWIKRNNSFAVFTGKNEIKAEKYYIEQVAEIVAYSSAFLGFDLGNELTTMTWLDKKANTSSVDWWQRELLSYCSEKAPGRLHSNGVDHQPWFYTPTYNSFSRQALSNAEEVIPLHCWTEYTGAKQHSGLLGNASIYISDYMAQLSKAYSIDAHKPVWIQEIGCSSLWLNECDSIENFAVRTLETIADIPDCWGVTWWCSHDISSQLQGYNPLEYDLGVLDTGNRPKPYAKVISEWISNYRKNPVKPQSRTKAMLYEPNVDEWKNIDRYLSILSTGIKPTIILPENVNNSEWKNKRNIQEIL